MTRSAVGLLAVNSSRSRAYLNAMADCDLLPESVIYLSGGSADDKRCGPATRRFDNETPFIERVSNLDLEVERLATRDPNAPEVVSAVRRAAPSVFVYAGPPGVILREILGCGKRFLHMHPGRLPECRGSTTVYYSLLLWGRCDVTAIFLDQQLDAGPILASRTYPPPEDRRDIDHGYDPAIRADLLAQVLRDHAAAGTFRLRPQGCEGQTYFVMHPVLRHVAILGTGAPAAKTD